MSRKKKTDSELSEVRVAIYTRQSVADDKEFGSLEAQRQAIEAYIESQRSQGWIALPTHYSDSGFSGGNVDRPALEKLLADIESGQIDIVAVYKLDRLSRSLSDFIRLMDLFEQYGVGFVSTTQSFNTSTSLGRMTVNLLATFATYERDMIRERTHDKMAASRKRGMWTGGPPVLGYDAVEKKLAINPDEAEQVRQIFRVYLELGSILGVVNELRRREIRTKRHTAKSGRVIGGRYFDRAALKRLLTSAIFVGKVRYQGELYDGEHEAIVDEATWDKVQSQLAQGSRTRPKNTRWESLLGGLLRCAACGEPMQHHFSRKGGRQYSYYVCSRYLKEGKQACPDSRVSAHELDAFVVERIQAIGRDPTVIAASIDAAKSAHLERRPVLESELAALMTRRKALNREKQNIIDAIAKNGSDSLLKSLGEREAQLASLNEEIAAAQAELAALSDQHIDEADLARALKSFTPVWETLTQKEQARLLDLVIERVDFDAKSAEVEITFRPAGVRTLLDDRRSA